jgi:hypothetical protein
MAAEIYYPTIGRTGDSLIYKVESNLGKTIKSYTEPISTGGDYLELKYAAKKLDRYLAKQYMLESLWDSGATTATTSTWKVNYNTTTTTAGGYEDLFEKNYTGAVTATAAFDYYLRKDEIRWKEWNEKGWIPPKLDPAARIRELIRARQAPLVIVPHRAVDPMDDREFRARETLRRMIGEKAFQDYMRKGFTSVRAKSGRVYQIFPGHQNTVVWENGQVIQNLCVDLRGGFAPTDSVIMRLILVQTDEEDFWAKSNKFAAYPRSKQEQRTIDFRPLPEIFAELKAQAA